MYKNFICYRGGSSAGILFAEDIYKRCKEEEEAVGRTYYSLYKEDSNEIRNFLNDPGAYLCEVTNLVMLLTKDFLGAFLLNGEPNPDSVTRIEIDEALKNKNLKFIPVIFPDFSWEGTTDGMVNKDILVKLWGEDAMRRIVGSPPIQFVFQYKKQVVEQILGELDSTGTLKNRTDAFKGNISFRLESSPSVMPKRIFCGREEELKQIKEVFDSGERILFLQGIGGIGKTEIAKQYAKRNKAQYDTLVYATYNSTVVELVSSQSSFKIDPQFPRQVLSDGTQESDISYFKRKLDLIREITNERTLIIIDNFDVMDDEYFSELTNANYKLLITTRCDYSRLFPTIKIEPLDSIEMLKRVFLDNYEGYMVDEDDPHLEELIELVNRHTYTIELIAQHMENSGQTTDEMIEVLKKQGIVSLTEEVRGADKTQVAYENLLKMFKVFDLNEEDKNVLKVLSLIPLSGVDVKDLRNWMGVPALKSLRNLESRSWITTSSNGVALHPIIRDVVRHELPFSLEEAKPFLEAFNETVKEEKSWHYPIGTKSYYADICAEIIGMFPEINEATVPLYKNVELLFSFGVKPGQAIEIGTRLFKYYAEPEGEGCYSCGYYAFQIGWTYLFNLQLVDSVKNSIEWFDRSYAILSKVELHNQDEYAAYGHLLSHLSRSNLVMYEETKDPATLEKAREWAMKTIENNEKYFDQSSPYYGRRAVA
ncbi:MAG: ATP-binding protein, partial [Bacilli bacterium]|nr:ATP-binding protein [Bacilli bacterium]